MSDRGGGVPLRKIERLFSYMYSTAPSPVIDNARNAPLVRRSCFVSLHLNAREFLQLRAKVFIRQTSSHGLAEKSVHHKSFSFSWPALTATVKVYMQQSHVFPKLALNVNCVFSRHWLGCNLAELQSAQSVIYSGFNVCVCAGWLRLWPSHLTPLRQVLPGRPPALLDGGIRHISRHLL